MIGILWTLLAVAAVQPEMSLPRVTKLGGMPLMEALAARQTSRDFSSRKLPAEVLSRLLWSAYGVNRPDTGGRTAPSAHNWKVIEIYVALEQGLYRYDADRHRLEPIAAQDAREIAGTQDFVAAAPLNLIYVARMDKMNASAEDTAEDLLVWAAVEAGAIAQNVGLFCASEGLGGVVRAGVQRARFARAANLPANHRILLAQTVGYPR